MVSFIRFLCFAVAVLLAGCGGSVSEDLFPNGQEEIHEDPPTSVPVPNGKEHKTHHEHHQLPDLGLVADVVPDLYYLNPTCCGDVQDLGLAAQGSSPEYAYSPEKHQWYQVTGRVKSGIYLTVADECRAGGPYEGYDLFTLEPIKPVARYVR